MRVNSLILLVRMTRKPSGKTKKCVLLAGKKVFRLLFITIKENLFHTEVWALLEVCSIIIILYPTSVIVIQ